MSELSKENKRHTYTDYCTWDDGKRWELIDGVPYMMSPAPSRRHQELIIRLLEQLIEFLKDKPCKVYVAPFDVRLNADTYDDTVVQPDIVVICDHSKLDDAGCVGAPDMVIEITSPSTAKRDRCDKFRLYQRAGVREYWIADPDSKTVSVHILKNSEYVASVYDDTDTAPVHVLDGCVIDLSDVFAEQPT